MIIAAAGEDHRIIIMIALLVASVGTFLSVGIKLPYFIWYGGKESAFEAKDPPWNMQVAMAIAAFFCFFIGIYPDYLYHMLPYPVAYHPYTAYHISETMQLFGFTGLGVYLMAKSLKPHATINLDLDWLYRKGAKAYMWFARNPVSALNEFVSNLYKTLGLSATMAVARKLSWFDWHGIDWCIDGFARNVVGAGGKVRMHITGKVQHYIGGAVVCMFIIVGLVLIF
jgi:multicomponent Na+:H+ antiporter subunit D